jgi:hypothetical protein
MSRLEYLLQACPEPDTQQGLEEIVLALREFCVIDKLDFGYSEQRL